MPDHKTPSGRCAVEEGDECEMPNRRKKIYFDYGVNVPTVVAIIMMLAGGVAYLMKQNDRITVNEGEIKTEKLVRETADKGIVEHNQAVEQVAIRDRMEMRDDIKEVKALATILVKRR